MRLTCFLSLLACVACHDDVTAPISRDRWAGIAFPPVVPPCPTAYIIAADTVPLAHPTAEYVAAIITDWGGC